MSEIFPEPIRNLPAADIPIEGLNAYLSQADTHQIIFMEFKKDADLPEHSHAAHQRPERRRIAQLTIDFNIHLEVYDESCCL